MEQAARAAGIADPISDHDLEAARDTTSPSSPNGRKPSTTANTSDRVPIPLPHRRSFSTTASAHRTPAASTRSRANSNFTARTGDGGERDAEEDVPPTPVLPWFQGQGQTLGPDKQNDANISTPQQQHQQSQQSHPPTPSGPLPPPPAPAPDAEPPADPNTTTGPPWDPLHPCWPHPNPHVPLTSPLSTSTRIIRLQRDYRTSGDMYPQYIPSFPEILEPFLSQDDFKALITPLNTLLREVFDPFRKRHWADAVLGVVTGWVWDDLGLSGVKKGVSRIEGYIEGWNRDVGRGKGVEVVSLRRTAFLCLDLQVPDPSGLLVREGLEGEEEVERSNGHAVNGHAINEHAVNGHVGTGSAMNGSAIGGAYTTTDGRTDTDARSVITDRTEDEEGTSVGNGTSVRTSGSFSRRRDEPAQQRPVVPPIPQQYLAGGGGQK